MHAPCDLPVLVPSLPKTRDLLDLSITQNKRVIPGDR